MNNTNILTVTTVTPAADVGVTNAAPVLVAAGSSYTNMITVTNLGPSVASNVVVVDVGPGGVLLSNVVVSLPAGGVTNFNVVVSAPGSGPVTNVVTVGATTGDPNLVNNTNVAVTAVTPEADLAAGKSGAGVVFASSNLTYTVTVTNFGPSAAGGVLVTDGLPAGVTFVSASGGGATNVSGQVVWPVGAMSVNQVSNLTLTVMAPASGTLTNVASVGSPTPDPVPTNNVSPPVTTSVTPVADVGVTNAAPVLVAAGSSYTNMITVTNLGPSVASNVVVVDVGPGGVLLSNVVVSLPAGGVTNFNVVVSAPGSGPVTNVVTVGATTGDPNLVNNTNVAVTAVTPEADLAAGKSGAGVVFASSNLTYTVTVTNFGPSAAGGVLVTDGLPAGVTFVSASGGGATNVSGQVVWPVGAMSVNQVSNLTLTVMAPASGTLTNVASVGSPTPDPVPTNNVSPPVTTSVTPVADVGVTNAAPVLVAAGSSYTNMITVTNLGPSVASNVVVVDVGPGGVLLSNVVVSLPAGGVTNFNVVVSAPGSGPVTNVVTVGATTGDPNLVNNTNVAVTAVTPEADLAAGKSGAGVVFAFEQPDLHGDGDEFWALGGWRCVGDGRVAGGSDFCECERRGSDECERAGGLASGGDECEPGEQLDFDGDGACERDIDERGERGIAHA